MMQLVLLKVTGIGWREFCRTGRYFLIEKFNISLSLTLNKQQLLQVVEGSRNIKGDSYQEIQKAGNMNSTDRLMVTAA